jgi:hypothetical protein
VRACSRERTIRLIYQHNPGLVLGYVLFLHVAERSNNHEIANLNVTRRRSIQADFARSALRGKDVSLQTRARINIPHVYNFEEHNFRCIMLPS